MNIGHALVIGTAALGLFGHVASAQELSRYRGYVLESTLESVVATSGARETEVKTVHERPAKIQEMEWRAPYVNSGANSPTRSGKSRSRSTTTRCIRSSSVMSETEQTD